MKKEDVTLGQRLTVCAKLVRKQKLHKPHQYLNDDYDAFWKIVPIAVIDVIVIGMRTLSNGNVEYDSEAGPLYTPTEWFTALLVVQSLHRKPFYVKL